MSNGSTSDGSDPRFRAHLKLAEFSEGLLAARRKLEWRLTMGAMGLVGALTYYALRQEPGLGLRVHPCLGAAFLMNLFAPYVIVAMKIQISNRRDAVVSRWHRSLAEAVMSRPAIPLREVQLENEIREGWSESACRTLACQWPWLLGHLGLVISLACWAWVLVYGSDVNLGVSKPAKD